MLGEWVRWKVLVDEARGVMGKKAEQVDPWRLLGPCWRKWEAIAGFCRGEKHALTFLKDDFSCLLKIDSEGVKVKVEVC